MMNETASTPTVFGERLRALRQSHRWSLAKLGKAIGSSKAHVWRLEVNGEANPTLETLLEL